MSYASDKHLPLSVRDHLPPKAQRIYREAFDHACRYGHADEATAHRIAWAAVKRDYGRANDRRIPRPEAEKPPRA